MAFRRARTLDPAHLAEVGYSLDTGYFYSVVTPEGPVEGFTSDLYGLVEVTAGLIDWKAERMLLLALLAAPVRQRAAQEIESPASKLVTSLIV